MAEGIDRGRADVTLRRPAVDPAVPPAVRRLLTMPQLTTVQRDRRETAGAGTGMLTGVTAAAFIAVLGATPWAFGVLIFQGPTGWQSASGQVALVLAQFVVVLTAVLCAARTVRSG